MGPSKILCFNFFLKLKKYGAEPQKLMRKQQFKFFSLHFCICLGASEHIFTFKFLGITVKNYKKGDNNGSSQFFKNFSPIILEASESEELLINLE